MSYKASPKSIRLGISHNWEFKHHGKKSEFHFENKIKTYVNSLVDYVVPQAPTKVKTKKTQIRGFAVQPGMQGRTLISRSQNQVVILLYFYLNYDGATEKQISTFETSIRDLAVTLHKETNYNIKMRVMNYFMFWWRYELFLGINCPRRLLNKIKRCLLRHRRLVKEQKMYKRMKWKINYVKSYVKRFRRNQFFKRTIYPVVSAFCFFEFDSNLAAKLVALELQILRKHHKKFMLFTKQLFTACFKIWRVQNNITGIIITISGRTTNFRRQVRRTQKKIIRIGKVKRNYLATEAGHSMQLSYNRYGVISVQIGYQVRPMRRMKNSESILTASIIHFFSIKKAEEVLNNKWNVKDKNFFQYQQKLDRGELVDEPNWPKKPKFTREFLYHWKRKYYHNKTQPWVYKLLKKSQSKPELIKANIHSRSFLNWVQLKKKYNKNFKKLKNV